MGLKVGIFCLFALSISGCTNGQFFGMSLNGGASTTLQLEPSSTTVNPGQSMTFQAEGGTPPYQYQLNGPGSISSNGYYTAGTYTGVTQIQVTDANYNTAIANVSVVQSVSSNYSVDAENLYNGNHLWQATNARELSSNPPIQGKVIAASSRALDAQGDSVQSEFIQTNLKHPLVRMDQLVEGNQVVAVQAVIEDQFIVKLQPGFSESDLLRVIQTAGAHISKRISPVSSQSDTYLVSMNHQANQKTGATINADFLSERRQLKNSLKQIAQVIPNSVTRAPASEN